MRISLSFNKIKEDILCWFSSIEVEHKQSWKKFNEVDRLLKYLKYYLRSKNIIDYVAVDYDHRTLKYKIIVLFKSNKVVHVYFEHLSLINMFNLYSYSITVRKITDDILERFYNEK